MTSLLHSSARVFLVAGLIAVLVQGAFAHTYLSSVYLNGVALAEGDCVRPHPSTAFDSPIALVSDPGMTCGWLPQSASPANRKCPIAAGSTIGIQWHHQSTAATDDIVDPSHLGPIVVYLAKSDTGAGNVWFKIYEDGYTASDGKWAVDRLRANGGRVNVPLPSDIAPGNYLLRGELIALHGANALNGVQPYVGCVELTISGSGTANPSGVAFPGYYTNTDPGMLFNLYQAYSSYPIPGPAVYVSGSHSSSSGASTVAPTKAPTSAPSTAPTSAPTSKPTTPTSAPTNGPLPTYAPTSAPTSAPSNADIFVQLNGGSNAWWLGVIVSGGGETTVKVELSDSGSVSSWTALIALPYAYIYDKSIQLTLPISIRLTSSTGKQVTLSNVFTSMASSLIDTGRTYATTAAPTTKPTTAPTSAPTTRPTSAPTTRPTSAPTTRPTSAPTTRPTSTPTTKPTGAATPAPSGSTKVTVHPSANYWWFALMVSGNSGSVAKVELKDAGSVSAWTPMTNSQWGYSFATQGSALVTPLTVRVTSASGQSVTATISAITPNAVIVTSGQL